MEFPRIALKVSPRAFSALVNLGNRVVSNLTGNLNFQTISPPLTALTAAVTDVEVSLSLWGPKGNRGSKANYVDLCGKALTLNLVLKQMAQYVSNTAGIAAGTDYVAMKSIMITSGFELVKTKAEQGALEAVRNFHVSSDRSLAWNQVKLKWTRPLNAARGSVNNYVVMRNTTSDFSTAVKVGNTTKGEFIDTNTSAPASSAVTYYYWIVGFNPAGTGAPCLPITVTILGL